MWKCNGSMTWRSVDRYNRVHGYENILACTRERQMTEAKIEMMALRKYIMLKING